MQICSLSSTDHSLELCSFSVSALTLLLLSSPVLHILRSLEKWRAASASKGHQARACHNPAFHLANNKGSGSVVQALSGTLVGAGEPVTKSKQGSLPSKSMIKQGSKEDQGGFRDRNESSKAGVGDREQQGQAGERSRLLKSSCLRLNV